MFEIGRLDSTPGVFLFPAAAQRVTWDNAVTMRRYLTSASCICIPHCEQPQNPGRSVPGACTGNHIAIRAPSL